mgnify:CR=1 FL=1
MAELALILVIILWVLHRRKARELEDRIKALEEENDQVVAKINEMLKE